eukprot:211919-Prorocentrum_minimum.AAC.1
MNRPPESMNRPPESTNRPPESLNRPPCDPPLRCGCCARVNPACSFSRTWRTCWSTVAAAPSRSCYKSSPPPGG